MLNIVRVHLSVLIAAGFLMACQPNSGNQNILDSSVSPSLHFRSIFNKPIFQVVSDNGEPILSARVLIGMEENSPFHENLLITDSEGQFVVPDLWVDPEPVTIEAPGYVRATFFDVRPDQARTFVLKKNVVPQFAYELSGVTTGFQVKNRDKLVDFGLTIPVVKPEDLFQFDLDMILSPYTDTISVLGQQVAVPSNVTLPQQQERYIFPITLEKSNYRMGFFDGGTKHLISLTGTFLINPVFDTLRNGGSFADVINSFNMQGLSLHDVTLTQKNQRLDLEMNQNRIVKSRNVKAPIFNQNNEVVLGVSIATHPKGLFPVDVKRFNSNQVQSLKTFGNELRVLSVMKIKDEFDGKVRSERLSASLEPWSQDGQEFKFLPLMKDPVIKSPYQLSLSLVTVLEGYHESGALYKLTKVKQIKDRGGNIVREEKELLWEAYGPKWVAQVEFPRFPGQALPVGLKRWSASLFASKNEAFQVQSMKTLVQGEVTHVTHVNADFQ